MKIKHKSSVDSIRPFNDADIPEFTVLTGVNGSGKTHLLKAILAGQVTVSDIPIHDISYYSYSDFLYKTQQNLNSLQIDQARQAAWKNFCGQGNPKIDWRAQLRQQWNSIFVTKHPGLVVELEAHFKQNLSIWDLHRTDSVATAELKNATAEYISAVKAAVFNHPHFRKTANYVGLKKVVQKTLGPLHNITEEAFTENFVPSAQVDSPIATSLGVIFNRYRVNQFLWAHRQFDTNSSLDKSALFKRYEAEHEKPWDLINSILKQIHDYSGELRVFNFSISVPDDVNLRVENWQSYTYQPTLIDNTDGGARQFEQLSSGEQVLLALAISIYESRDDFVLPQLLLLDEVDASLHPSMARALLETLQKVFLARGTKVILATHSPSTIALAPAGSVHVVHKGPVPTKIESTANKVALELLTEGFATLESGLPVFNQIAQSSITIISEGRNTKYLQRALEIYKQSDVGVVTGMEAVTGKDQLRTLYQLLAAAPITKPILFIWDPDVSNSLVETANVIPMILPKNTENKLCPKGIENLFPEELFVGFIQRQEDSLQRVVESFDTKRKAAFESHVLSRNVDADFQKFQIIIQKIEEIRSKMNAV